MGRGTVGILDLVVSKAAELYRMSIKQALERRLWMLTATPTRSRQPIRIVLGVSSKAYFHVDGGVLQAANCNCDMAVTVIDMTRNNNHGMESKDCRCDKGDISVQFQESRPGGAAEKRMDRCTAPSIENQDRRESQRRDRKEGTVVQTYWAESLMEPAARRRVLHSLVPISLVESQRM